MKFPGQHLPSEERPPRKGVRIGLSETASVLCSERLRIHCWDRLCFSRAVLSLRNCSFTSGHRHTRTPVSGPVLTVSLRSQIFNRFSYPFRSTLHSELQMFPMAGALRTDRPKGRRCGYRKLFLRGLGSQQSLQVPSALSPS